MLTDESPETARDVTRSCDGTQGGSATRARLGSEHFRQMAAKRTTTMGHCVDFARLIKVYSSPQDGEARYSPAEVAFTEVFPVIDNYPDPTRICLSIVKRQNLTNADADQTPHEVDERV